MVLRTVYFDFVLSETKVQMVDVGHVLFCST